MDCQNRAAIALVQWKTETQTAVTLLYVAVTASASYEALEYTTWSTHCSLAATLRKVSGGVLAKLESQVSYRNKLEEMEAKLRIYGLKGATAEEQTTVELLAETAALMRMASLKEEKSNMQTALTAVGFASEGAAAISSYLMTIGSLAHSTQTYCLSDTGKTRDGKTKLSAAGCRHAQAADYSSGPGPEHGEVGNDGFTKVTGKPDGPNTGQSDKCGLFTHASSPESTGGIYITSASSTPSFGYGMLKIKTADQSMGLQLSDIKGKNETEDHKFWASCHEAVKTAQLMETQTEVTVDAAPLAVLAESTEMQSILTVNGAAEKHNQPEERAADLNNAK
ncbi:Trypanosome variant surface glycoprotein (A-type), putative [Trypanosoma equiperdum]|uniref:Trypanosome variant surface glycoprotein (A-type), putative n=1 Tax=Trypanosoma equiperdum TaxID=5694 RepID=A0A1G4HZ48_TRYEQ|nr:Trypanosome variant surface glycoprotein (A-type), putative [Trypanosoma equiperdum]